MLKSLQATTFTFKWKPHHLHEIWVCLFLTLQVGFMDSFFFKHQVTDLLLQPATRGQQSCPDKHCLLYFKHTKAAACVVLAPPFVVMYFLPPLRAALNLMRSEGLSTVVSVCV